MNKRVVYIDLLRVLACFAVIVIHVSALNQGITDIGSSTWQVFNVYNSLARFSVPAFVMISGMFMLDPGKELTLKQIYTKYVPRMLVIWLLWELFYAVVDFWNMKYTIDLQAIKPLIKDAMQGHFHLWYLPMFIGLYIVTPILRVITEKGGKTICAYFILLFFIFGSLLPMLPLFTDSDVIIQFSRKIPVTVVAGYVGYYMLGHYLNKYPLLRWQKNALYFLGLAGAAGTIVLASYYSFRFGSRRGFYDFYSAPIFFMSAGIFVFFKEVVSKIRFSEIAVKIIGSLSACSFGIYLIHAFITERINKLGLTTLSFDPILSVLAISVPAFIVSWLIMLVYKIAVKKIKKLMRKEKSPAQI